MKYYDHNTNEWKFFTDTKLKRLLLLAKYRGGDKRLYHYYYYLVFEGLIEWSLGTAFITKEGEQVLYQLLYPLEHGQDGNAAHC